MKCDNNKSSAAALCRRTDWRVLLVLGFLGLAALLVAVTQATSYQKTCALLQVWGVPALSDPFVDLRGVAAWIDLEQAGVDSSRNTTQIPLPSGAQMGSFLRNYPPIVLLLGTAGLSQNSVALWGWGLAVLYLVSIWVLAGKLSLKDALLWSLFTFSPLSILVLERANFDSVVFALLVLALLLVRRPFLAVLPILAAGLLKLFPMVAIAAFFAKFEKKNFAAGVFGIVVFGAYLLLIREELGTILSGLTTQISTCFGVRVIPNLLLHHEVIVKSSAPALGLALKSLAVLLAVGGFLLGFWLVSRSRANSEFLISPLTERSESGALMGIAIFCAMFFTGPQMDYKWIFLLLALPGILEWRKSIGPCRTLAGVWILLALIFSYWTLFSGETSLRNALLKQGIGWALYCVSCVVFGTIVSLRLLSNRTHPAPGVAERGTF